MLTVSEMHEIVKAAAEGKKIAADKVNMEVGCRTPLICAVRDGNIKAVKGLLENCANACITGSYGETVLHYAAMAGCVDVIPDLIRYGAEVNAKDTEGDTPLIFALVYNKAVYAQKAALVRVLLSHNADVCVAGYGGRTALSIAAKYGFADLIPDLIRCGAEVNAKDGEGPLMKALVGGKLEAAKMLLSHKADVCVTGYKGRTSLHAAAIGGVADLVPELIKRGAAVNATDKEKNTPLIDALSGGHRETARVLLSYKADVCVVSNVGLVALHFAAGGGFADLVQDLIDRGAAIDAQDNSNNTPLMCAVSEKKNASAMRVLLSHNARVDTVSSINQLTALMIASADGSLSMIPLLLLYGAELKEADEHVRKSIELAKEKSRFQIANFLRIAHLFLRNHITLDSLQKAADLCELDYLKSAMQDVLLSNRGLVRKSIIDSLSYVLQTDIPDSVLEQALQCFDDEQKMNREDIRRLIFDTLSSTMKECYLVPRTKECVWDPYLQILAFEKEDEFARICRDKALPAPFIFLILEYQLPHVRRALMIQHIGHLSRKFYKPALSASPGKSAATGVESAAVVVERKVAEERAVLEADVTEQGIVKEVCGAGSFLTLAYDAYQERNRQPAQKLSDDPTDFASKVIVASFG